MLEKNQKSFLFLGIPKTFGFLFSMLGEIWKLGEIMGGMGRRLRMLGKIL